jgi:nucleotide-binding universal stress UspA family protein
MGIGVLYFSTPAAMSACILVLTDFSAAANHALLYAAGLAAPLGAHLVVLHVDTQTSLLAPKLLVQEHPDPHSFTLALDACVRQLSAPTLTEARTGPLATVVAAAAARHRPVLIVVGRPHTEDLPDELVAPSALDVLPATPYPLLVVPYSASLTKVPRYLLLAADEEPFSLGDYAGSVRHLLNALDAQLSVVHVAPAGHEASNAQALEAVLQTGISIERPLAVLHHAAGTDPAEGIITAAATLHTDLLVLIARPRSFFGRLFHYSVTAQVVRHSAVPVLLLPAIAQAASLSKPPVAEPAARHITDSSSLWAPANIYSPLPPIV